MKNEKIALIGGSFDPIHPGHIQVIKKAAQLFDQLYVVVTNNEFKSSQSDLDQRLQLVKKHIHFQHVKIVKLENKYLATFAYEHNIKYLVRSARNNTDFAYELDMAKVNQKINHDIETILIIPNYKDIKYSSSSFKKFKIKKL